MGKILIHDLEVHYCVGVTVEERAAPQRLLLSLELEHDFSLAARTDDLAHTIDYYALSQRLLRFGEGRSWKLIEKLAADILDLVAAEFKHRGASVEIKKFVVPQAKYVAVRLSRDLSTTNP